MQNPATIDEKLERLLSEIKNLQIPTPLSYSEPEAAKILEISVISLQRERRSRKIAYSPVGRSARYTRQHLEEYLQRRTINAE